MSPADPALLRFGAEEVNLFSSASHDRNPLHVSELYARRTPFGRPVVFGVLAALGCLGRLDAIRQRAVSEIELGFRMPVFADTEYSLARRDVSPDVVELSLMDGQQVVMRVAVTLREGERDPIPSADIAWDGHLREAVDRPETYRTPRAEVTGQYAPEWKSTRQLLDRLGLQDSKLGARQLASLLWASYLVGMELPGQRALFVRLAVRFVADAGYPSGSTVPYSATVRTFDPRSQLLVADVRFGQAGGPMAVGEVTALVRSDVSLPSTAALAAMLPTSEAMRGKQGLVIGASRGLGAALALALASQGSTVMAVYERSEAAAEQIREASKSLPGEVQLLRGDAASAAWCEELSAHLERGSGRLDYLVCSAAPALLSLRLHPRTLGRVEEYVRRSLALAAVPMSVFLPRVSQCAGWVVTISSSAISNPPRDWPHYIAAKFALEGLTRAAAADHRAASFVIARPPRLRTDLVNTPLGLEGALPPEWAAARIVRRLLGPTTPGRVELLEDFA